MSMQVFGCVFALVLFLLGPVIVMANRVIPLPTLPLNAEVLRIARQADGKTVYAGRFTDHHIFRTLSNDVLDQTFYYNWVTSGFNNDVFDIKVLPDDSIIAGGKFTVFDHSIAGHIIRLKGNGEVDREFLLNAGTGFDGDVKTIVLLGQTLYMGGTFDSYNGSSAPKIIAIDSNGSMSAQFNAGGGFDGAVSSIRVDAESKELIVSGDFTSYNGKATPKVAVLGHDGAIKRFMPFQMK